MSVNPVNFAPYIYEPWWTDPTFLIMAIISATFIIGIIGMIMMLLPFRRRKIPLPLTEEQEVCNHDWERMGESDYSHCKKCLLMRHDVDGDLINPLIYREQKN